MEFDSEFPVPSYREREAISHYLKIESYFMASKDFYANPGNIKIRKLAVSVIARHWQGIDIDAFVPYLAMNYFDRFASRNPNSDADVRLVAICCLTIAAKIRTKSFSVDMFLSDKFVDFDHETIMRMELCILNGLEWRMRPVTPFCYLDYYYPNFKRLGGFKRRCINEIIVQAQGESIFLDYTPSDIALSSLLAATFIVYPLKFPSFNKPDGLTPCTHELVDLCLQKNINIERAVSETVCSSSGTVAIPQGQSEKVAAAKTETEADQQRRAKGKAVVVAEIEEEEEEEETKVGVPISEIVPASEAAPKKLMNFDLLWPTDDPFFVREPIDESRITRIRPPCTIGSASLRHFEVPAGRDCFDFEFPSCSSCNIG